MAEQHETVGQYGTTFVTLTLDTPIMIGTSLQEACQQIQDAAEREGVRVAEQRIEVGQVWESKDWRDHGLTATVVSVSADGDYDNGFATIQRKVRSRIRFSTLRKRYKLIQQAQA
jgi:hypothetical protein